MQILGYVLNYHSTVLEKVGEPKNRERGFFNESYFNFYNSLRKKVVKLSFFRKPARQPRG
jgi:hypothetical protein